MVQALHSPAVLAQLLHCDPLEQVIELLSILPCPILS